MYQHKHHLFEGFTSKYDVTRLVWYAQGDDIAAAISLEKKIKNRNRQWKIDLIKKSNPDWVDLAADWMDSATPRHSARNAAESRNLPSTPGFRDCARNDNPRSHSARNVVESQNPSPQKHNDDGEGA
jgi:predicted GIY-YIG superfamily endonuclease